MAVWPPANWTDWPGTRIGALVFNGILTILFLWGFCWTERRFKRILRGATNLPDHIKDAQQGEEEGEEGSVLLSKTHRFWGIFAVGRDTVAAVATATEAEVGEGTFELLFIKERLLGMCCFCGVCAAVGGGRCATTTRQCRVTLQDMKTLKQAVFTDPPLLFNRLIWSTVLGCAAGLWLHFWPCIWWTCDWSDSDGEGVRGAIWFATWAIVGLFLCCCNTMHTAIECKVKGEQWVLTADDLCAEVLLKTVKSECGKGADLEAFVSSYETALGGDADSHSKRCGVCCCV